MCLICDEIAKNKLTPKEARHNLEEMRHILDNKHIHKVLRLIWRLEDADRSLFQAPGICVTETDDFDCGGV